MATKRWMKTMRGSAGCPPVLRAQMSIPVKIRSKSVNDIQKAPSSASFGRMMPRTVPFCFHSSDLSLHAPSHSPLPQGFRSWMSISGLPDLSLAWKRFASRIV